MESVSILGEDGDDPSVVLFSTGGPTAPAEPVGVPAKQLEELMPKSVLTPNAREVGTTCSICICDMEPNETVRAGRATVR